MTKSQKANLDNKEGKSQLSASSRNPMEVEIAGLIESAKNKAQEAQENNHSIGEKLQLVIDEAEQILPLIPYLKPEIYESVKDIWSSVDDQMTHTNKDLKQFKFNLNSTAGSATVSSGIVTGAYINDGFYNEASGFSETWVVFEAFASRPKLRDDVIELFKEFGFDVPQVPGDKSPQEQFTIAHESFQNPITVGNPVSTSLLPMRESIDTIIASLLRMRPTQEETKNERAKIISIGLQLKKENLPQNVVEELADEWHSLKKDLSGFKKKDAERTDWLARLNRGTSFLYSLLIGLDSRKLKR